MRAGCSTSAAAASSHAREVPRGRLRVSAPIVGHHFLLPVIPDFVARYPEVELDIHFSDRAVDLIEEGIDVAIRSGDMPDSRLVSRPLNPFRLRLWASPAYLERHGTPLAVRDLERHATVRFRHPNSGKLLEWPLPPQAADVEARLRTVLACNNIEAVLGAALRGLGIACMPDFLASDAAADGRLLNVLGEEVDVRGRFNALWPSSRHLSPKVRVFVDHLGERLAG